ncbi:hypothetical protein [Pseudoponticoccus marisrubri]|uniref:Curlin n=1 Tax=Pseudoponticoccus marisrubri TaxID=1685382 RepID=A0A0W7WLT9_9RHOB|nr:hypothetical protein [Pseudoponticoccus marisrubri]KUF11464.1 hypothetical protein AVJ23_06780 [Pseudoponticoccus marisrubri]
MLGAGAAGAQGVSDNLVNIEQFGSDNTAGITQSGANNVAGPDGLDMVQDGFFNQLTIEQNGDDNSIGALSPGLFQNGQSTTQTVFNNIDIFQFSDENRVGSVEQQSAGTVPNGANDLLVEQSGGDRNVIDYIVQFQAGGQAPNLMSLTMSGADNYIEKARQYSFTTVRNEPNSITVVLSGDRNGRYVLGGPAALPLLESSTLIQRAGASDPRGNGNFIDLLISGDDNAFAIDQGGRFNSVGFLSVLGNQNELGLRQDGDENDIVVSPILGDGNSIGIDQLGTNLADVTVLNFSDDNDVSIDQTGTNDAFVTLEGNRNTIIANQTFTSGMGGDNLAEISFDGDENSVRVSQEGSNVVNVAVTGNGNNTANVLDPAKQVFGLDTGRVEQIGFDNIMTADVTGDRNVMASLQGGDLNTILLSVFGDDNEAAFLQMGSNNNAVVNQMGVGNRAFIRQ